MDNQKNIQHYLQKFSIDENELLTNKKTQVTYLRGETIMKQGAYATHVMFVNSGLLKIFLQPNVNKQVNLRLVNSGEFMAYFTIFGETVYPYSAVAMKDTTVCMIDKEAFKSLLLGNPHLGLSLTSKNYQKENRYLDVINNLSSKQMRGKLASALLYLSSEKFKTHDVFDLLTRQEIADFASITTESAIKFIKEFEKEEILKLDNKKIVITNLDELTKICKIG